MCVCEGEKERDGKRMRVYLSRYHFCRLFKGDKNFVPELMSRGPEERTHFQLSPKHDDDNIIHQSFKILMVSGYVKYLV